MTPAIERLFKNSWRLVQETTFQVSKANSWPLEPFNLAGMAQKDLSQAVLFLGSNKVAKAREKTAGAVIKLMDLAESQGWCLADDVVAKLVKNRKEGKC